MAGVSLEGGEEALSLNIMPMLDIFSIMILFLLMSFSTDPISHDMTKDIEVPFSVTMRSLDEIPQISITKTSIKLGDEEITPLVDGEVPEAAMSQGGIQPLFDKLQVLAANNKRIKASLEGEEEEESADNPNPDSLTMEIDKTHRFKLIRRVMLSAQQAEFVSFKLMANKMSK
jgi:biopolymer transport protein ExbD